MDELSRFYRAEDPLVGTHLALRWRGRVRYTVPRDGAAQQACWKVFQPGRLGIAMRAMAGLPRMLGAEGCVESDKLALVRETIGREAGLSCCRAGAPGPWSKETILLLEKKTAKPQYLVKAGANAAVDSLLRNEANWLRRLREQESLSDNVPELVAHRPGSDLCFIVQRVLSGRLDFEFGELQLDFLRKLQRDSLQSMRYEESRLSKNLRSRFQDLEGHLTEAWSTRLARAMRRIEESLAGRSIPLVAAHNDFTPWNIRVECDTVRVFDWEYADDEQLPLFDLLHFTLMPMALRNRPTDKMVQAVRKTLQLSESWIGKERCYDAETQALAYLVNLCTLYLWGAGGVAGSHPVLGSYAHLIDHMLLL